MAERRRKYRRAEIIIPDTRKIRTRVNRKNINAQSQDTYNPRRYSVSSRSRRTSYSKRYDDDVGTYSRSRKKSVYVETRNKRKSGAARIWREINRALRKSSLTYRKVGLLHKIGAREYTRCELNKRVRRHLAFKAKGKGKKVSKQRKRTHRC